MTIVHSELSNDEAHEGRIIAMNGRSVKQTWGVMVTVLDEVRFVRSVVEGGVDHVRDVEMPVPG